MRYFKTLIFICCLVLLGACSAGQTLVQYKQGGAQVTRVNIGDISVMAVEDAAGSMDVSLFSGPLSASKRKGYFKSGKAPSSVNVFLLTVSDKLVLVDAGWGPDGKVRGNALGELAKIGIRPEMIDFVFLTHMHGDHISGLLSGGKALYPNAQILAAKPEIDFWLDASTLRNEAYKNGAELSRKVAAAYAGRFDSFKFDDVIIPGVKAIAATGHTPGHTAFLVGFGARRLLIAGDFLHAAALQFAEPDESARYDMNPEEAATSRRALMQMAVDENLIIGGMHIPFSGMGTLRQDGSGYEFIPLITK